MCVSSLLLSSEHMWHKALLIGYSILSSFSISFTFFISVNTSGLFLLLVAMYARGFCCFLVYFFLLIPTIYLLVLLDIISGVELCVVLWERWLCAFYVLVYKGWILYSFRGGGFWSGGIVGCLLVCSRYVLIWPFYVFYKYV